MYNKEVLSKRIKELRQKKDLTQRQLAKMANTTPTSVSAYEKGQKTPSIEVLCNIANALETSVDWLCGNKITKPICTYADVIKSLLSALSNIEFTIDGTFDMNTDIKWSYINICNDVLFDFFVGYRKMKAIYDDGIIDDDMLNSWLNGQYLKYNIPVTNSKEDETYSDFDRLLDDDEDLPF